MPLQNPDPRYFKQEDKVKDLWDYFSPNYDLGTDYKDFQLNMLDPTKRKKFYDFFSINYDVGKDFKEFEQTLAPDIAPLLNGLSPDMGSRFIEKRAEEYENKFQSWYQGWANRTGLNTNPDDPQHKYDYRAAFMNNEYPVQDETGQFHWPSKYKSADHPNRFVYYKGSLIDTITGKPSTVEYAESESKSLNANYNIDIPEINKYPLKDEEGYNIGRVIFREALVKPSAKITQQIYESFANAALYRYYRPTR